MAFQENLHTGPKSSVDTNGVNDVTTDNIIHIPIKTEAHVATLIKKRFENKIYYIWAGQALVAVHPYQEREELKDTSTDHPNVNSLVYKAWFRLLKEVSKVHQAIVISGDSGSGKTYTACLALKYIGYKQKQSDIYANDNLLWLTWSSIPLLAAFGNASTIYNRNSSRFGQLLQLQYLNGKIVGSYIQTYMLEKCRVSGPNIGEGNFHIFHQIIENMTQETLSALHLSKDITYKIVPAMRNGMTYYTYADVQKSLTVLQLGNINEIFTVLSIIMNLGNVEFEAKENLYCVSKETMKFAENAENLLQTNAGNLINSLTVRIICGEKRDSLYKSPCTNEEECEYRKNCLMRFLYEMLFTWLVDCINERFFQPGNFSLLGIVDVYGFEVFQHNTFEQLCINYANERLQHYFLKDYVIELQNDLKSEGFHVQDIDDNEFRDRIMILDGAISIFSILNDECAVQRHNSDSYVNMRLTDALKGNSYYVPCGNNYSTLFSICHYAGIVKYDIKTMIGKNIDKIPEDMLSLLSNSCNFSFLKQILHYDFQSQGRKTQLRKFKKSLDSLMKILDNSNVHYIKCLKPNSQQLPGVFDSNFFGHQMKVNGILQILNLGFQNYSIKLQQEEMKRRFSITSTRSLENMLTDQIHVGRKFVYLTDRAYHFLEKTKILHLTLSVRTIQKVWRKRLGIRYKAAITIQRFFRKFLAKKQMPTVAIFIDISNTHDAVSTCKTRKTNAFGEQLNNLPCTLAHQKVEEYVNKLTTGVSFDSDIASLEIEKIINFSETKSFKRIYYFGDHIISRLRITEVPVLLHVRKTCIPYSHLLPRCEYPKGLPDIFEQKHDGIKKWL